MTKRKKWLLAGSGAVIAIFAAFAYLLAATADEFPLRFLDGHTPMKEYRLVEKPTSGFVQVPGKRLRYELDRPFKEVLAAVERETSAQKGWNKKQVASMTTIWNYYQRLPGDKYNRWTVGVEDGVSWNDYRKRVTAVTVSYPTREVGKIERAGYWLREKLGL